jgi:hypothetical protein
VKEEEQLNNEDLIEDTTSKKVKFAKDIIEGAAEKSDVEMSEDEEDDAAFFLNPLLMTK